MVTNLRPPALHFGFSKLVAGKHVRVGNAEAARVAAVRRVGGGHVAVDAAGAPLPWAVHGGGSPFITRMHDGIAPQPDLPFEAGVRDNAGAFPRAPPHVRVPFASPARIVAPADLFPVVRRLGAELGVPVPADADIKGGYYGKVLFATMTPELGGRLRALLARLKYPVAGARMPPAGHALVIKAFRPGDGAGADDAVYDVHSTVHELRAHRSMQDMCRVLGGATHCLRAHMPALWFGGVDPVTGAGIAVMDAVDGVTLSTVLQAQKALTARQYVGLEKATVLMLAMGVAHADYHGDNVLLRPDGSACVLDFGFAVRFPAGLLPAGLDTAAGLQRALESPEAWIARINEFTGGVLLARKVARVTYNPEIKLLRVAYAFTPPGERAKIPAERARAWHQQQPAQQPAQRPARRPGRRPRPAPKPKLKGRVGKVAKPKSPTAVAGDWASGSSGSGWSSGSSGSSRLARALRVVSARRSPAGRPVPMSID